MDRQIIYPGSIPLDTDLLSIQRNTIVALGYMAQAAFGTATIVDGLACSPTAPASLTISVGPGSILSLGVIDTTPFGSLPADATDPLVKMGITTTATPFSLTAPTTSGQSINYLIQASLAEADTSPVVLPYYNAADPTIPFSGPANSGTAQNTQRLQRVQLQLKPSAPANSGSQVTPVVDSGWTGLFVITVNYGQTQITNSNIVTIPTAPFIPFKLGQLAPGFSRMACFGSSNSLTIPNGVSIIKVRLVGGGGGGGAGATSLGGGGGGGGGYAEGVFAVTPGQFYPITVGNGGSGGITDTLGPTAGGSSSFGGLLSATGGAAGVNAATFAAGGAPGHGAGGSFNTGGGHGSDGSGSGFVFAGNGGASYFGGGGRAASAGGVVELNAQAPGSGGGGVYGVAGNGGNGAAGLVIVEY